MKKVAVLFVRKTSSYKNIAICDCYDRQRDARNFRGALPVVAHPPCRLFGRMKHLSTARQSEKFYAYLAVGLVRRNGGVLEHPAHSTLFREASLPEPGWLPDKYGFTIEIDQKDFGHKASKPTWLYICGVSPSDIPPLPPRDKKPTHSIAGNSKGKRACSIKLREYTPAELQHFLIDVALRTSPA